MTIKALVMTDLPDAYLGKRGLVKQHIITVQDMEPGQNRLKHHIDYTLSEEEKDKYAGKLQDKTVVLGIRELQHFGGRIRAKGCIVENGEVKGWEPKGSEVKKVL